MIRTFAFTFLLASASSLAWSPAHAQGKPAMVASSPEVTALTKFLTEKNIDKNDFADVFLKQVSVDQLQPVRDQLTQVLGDFHGIRRDGERYLIDYEKGVLPAIIHLDDAGKIDGLRLLPPQSKQATKTDKKQDEQKKTTKETADNKQEVELLRTFFTSKEVDESWFAASFLSQVPASKIKPIREQITAALGDFKQIKATDKPGHYQAIFAKGHVPTVIGLNNQGKIETLFMKPPVLSMKDGKEAIKKINALPGKTSLLVRKNGRVIHAKDSDKPLAVGSSFKLSILATLMDDIKRGKRQWSDVVTMEERFKSLPSGTLQNWPNDAQLTLYSLAARMISESDNTATDILLHTLGRAAVEKNAPQRNRPFLSTREAFVLKNPKNKATAKAYIKAFEAYKRAQLDKLANLPLPTAADFSGGQPMVPEVEWFYSNEELCDVMDKVADSSVTQISTGALNASKKWKRISYKGGSEIGVLNLTYGLTSASGDQYCVSVTQNNSKALNETDLMGLVTGLIDSLK